MPTHWKANKKKQRLLCYLHIFKMRVLLFVGTRTHTHTHRHGHFESFNPSVKAKRSELQRRKIQPRTSYLPLLYLPLVFPFSFPPSIHNLAAAAATMS